MGVDSELGIGCLQSFSILVFETQSLVEHGAHQFIWAGFSELPSTEGTDALPYLVLCGFWDQHSVFHNAWQVLHPLSHLLSAPTPAN